MLKKFICNILLKNTCAVAAYVLEVEPTIGIEPMNLFLTKEALYRLSYVGIFLWPPFAIPVSKPKYDKRLLERETRFELATSSLEG